MATIEIGIVVYPGAQAAAVHGLTDLFHVAERLASRRGVAGRQLLAVSHWRAGEAGVARMRDDRFAPGPGEIAPRSANGPGVVLLPPSLGEPPTPEIAAHYKAWLVERHRAGATLGSVCAGAFLLGETGLLKGRTVTTHWAHAEALGSRFPQTRIDADRLVVDDGDIITAGGVMAWTDLGLKLVERFLGAAVMLDTARFLLVDPPGREQRYYSTFSPNLAHGDAAILKAQHWLQATLASNLSLAAAAEQAGLEERTFLRRFRRATGLTAIDYGQRVRIAKAQDLLQSGGLSVQAVAWDVGYGDLSAFRKVFQRITGLTPGEYRRRFSAAGA